MSTKPAQGGSNRDCRDRIHVQVDLEVTLNPGLNPSPIHAMKPIDQRNVTPDLKEVRAMLVGILFYCPLGGNPRNCSCHNIRKLAVGKRFEWLDQLNDEEALDIYRKHILCLKRKAGRSDYTSWPMTTGLNAAGVSM